ncbi:MAG: hypothetical protein KAH77_03135 [Thiomargarita sp.]|nr:hypothetical protein [Thiomargarita sp.]
MTDKKVKKDDKKGHQPRKFTWQHESEQIFEWQDEPLSPTFDWESDSNSHYQWISDNDAKFE